MSSRLVHGTLAVLLAACGSGEDGTSSTKATADVPAPADKGPLASSAIDAGIRPSREMAATVLHRFSGRLLSGDLEGARLDLRVPEGLRDAQVDFFLKELRRGGHINELGVTQVLAREFGPLAQRLGERAIVAARNAELPLGEAYAFGDATAAAILHWDGTRFRVAALHQLAAQEP